MKIKKKIITGHTKAANQLFAEAQSGSYDYAKIDVATFSAKQPFPSMPPASLEKYAAVGVAFSGSMEDSVIWGMAFGYRVDNKPGKTSQKEYNLDPLLFAFDTGSSEAKQTAVQIYHGNFESRSFDIQSTQSIEETISDLRAKFVPESGSFESAPPEFKSAFRSMINNHKSVILGST